MFCIFARVAVCVCVAERSYGRVNLDGSPANEVRFNDVPSLGGLWPLDARAKRVRICLFAAN